MQMEADAAREQAEELEAVRAIFGADDLEEEPAASVTVHGDTRKLVHRLSVRVRALALCAELDDGSADARAADAIALQLELPQLYPFSLPGVQILGHGIVSDADAERLHEQLLATAAAQLGQPVVYDLFLAAQDFVVRVLRERAERNARSGAAHLCSAGLRVQAALRREVLDRAAAEAQLRSAVAAGRAGLGALDAASAAQLAQVCGAPVDMRAEAGCAASAGAEAEYLPLASHFVTVQEVFRQLPEHIIISKIENIMRADIAARFDLLRLALAKEQEAADARRCPARAKPRPVTGTEGARTQDMSTAGGAARRLDTVEVAFHGTHCTNAASIVRTGLVVPGEGNGIRVRNGTAYGRGIYLGLQSDVSLGYCQGDGRGQGLRLFVCAILRGKRESVVYEDGSFVVLRGSQQVLPLYVVHFSYHAADADFGACALTMSDAGTIFSMPVMNVVDRGSGEMRMSNRMRAQDFAQGQQSLHAQAREAARESAMANASFYFDTRRFQVLDVADPDDDDDETSFMAPDLVRAMRPLQEDDTGTLTAAAENYGYEEEYQAFRWLPAPETDLLIGFQKPDHDGAS